MGAISMEIDAIDAGEHNEQNEATADVIEVANVGLVTEESDYRYPSLFTSKSLIELANSSWSRSKKAKHDVQPYLRGCKWSPDGTCCLAVVNNDGVHLTELSKDLYSGNVSSDRAVDIMDSIIHVKEAGMVYDFCWYPGMNSGIPDSCCWITTKRFAPIQMWDAFDGSLRCSYRGFNDVDEMEPAVAVTFSNNGTKIIAGYKKCFRTFDVERPGRDFEEHKTSSPATCFDTSDNLLAVGSWNTSIKLFNVSQMGTYKSIGNMHAHSGGVTQVKFAPDGLRLVSGGRKDHRLLVWDIRYYRRPLNILSRKVKTNQKIQFDISRCGKYLVTGGTDGVVKVWDSDHVDWKTSLGEEHSDGATYEFPLHKDCCNSVSIHPLRPILATGSGQYHFTDPIIMQENSNDSEESCICVTDPPSVNSGVLESQVQQSVHNEDIDIRYTEISENSLVFWWIGEANDLT